MGRKAGYLKIISSALILSALLAFFSGCSEPSATKDKSPATATVPTTIPSRAPATVAVTPPAPDEARVDTGSADLTLLTAQIKDTANTFWTYAKSREWDSMWHMLHPDAQSSYEGENDFIQRSEDVFHDVSLKSFTLGSIEFKKNQNGVDYSEVQLNLFISTLGGDPQDSTSTTFFIVKYNNDWMPVLIWDKTNPGAPSMPIPSSAQKTIILY